MTVRARPLPYALAVVLGLGAAGLTACGAKTNPAMIPAANAEQLKADLDDVLAAIGSSDCAAADRAIRQVRTDLLELPSGTSRRLQDRLEEGVARLAEQAARECEADTQTETTATTQTETLPTTTEPPVITTAPPPTTPTETATTPPATTTTPPVATVTTPEDTGGTGAP